jgi:histidinol dehydrogenase
MSQHLPIFDQSSQTGREGFQARLQALRETAVLSGEHAETTAQIVSDVAQRGDDAVVQSMQKFTDPDFSKQDIRVQPEEIEQASQAVKRDQPELIGSLERAIDQVRRYQAHIYPQTPAEMDIGGARLGLRYRPVPSAGLCVPGGSAVLFSTLVMLAVPAQVAGIANEQISVIHPPPTRQGASAAAGDISPIVLAACQLLDIEKVYRIGGAQGVAALAFGTESVEPVSMVAGPGNIFVQLAKAQVAGRIGTDNGFYGPSEIVSLADETADPVKVASDLIAQAEHDPGKCFLLTWDRQVIQRITSEVDRQLAERNRQEAIVNALKNESAAVLAQSKQHAIDLANELAAEHVNLAVSDPEATLQGLDHAGEVFLGDQAPVATGDYYAGPSHCLPTGTTARFTSGVSVHTFLKRTGTVAYPDGVPQQAIDDIARLAEAEGLDAHAESVRKRADP